MQRLGPISLLTIAISAALIAATGFNPAGLLADSPGHLSVWRNLLGLTATVVNGLGWLGLAMAMTGALLRHTDHDPTDRHLI